MMAYNLTPAETTMVGRGMGLDYTNHNFEKNINSAVQKKED